MDKARFWKFIDASRAESEGDPDGQMDALRQALMTLEPEEIVAFDRIFCEYHDRAYTWDLWGAAYVIGGGCSDDGFMDFRSWLISKGEKVYESALANPESLAEVVTEEDNGGQVEGFQYVASEAWEEKTGKDMEDFPLPGFERRSEPAGKSWDESDLDRRFPKLCEKFEA